MDPTLSAVLQFAAPAAGAVLSTIVQAIAAGDVKTLDQLAAVCPHPDVLKARDEAAITAARERNVARLKREANE